MKAFLKIAGAVGIGVFVGDLAEAFLATGMKTALRKMKEKTDEIKHRMAEEEAELGIVHRDHRRGERRMGFGETYMK